MKTYPLTETQLGMFLEWNADRTSSQYVLCFVYSLPKSVDPARLERAVLAAVDAHPVFRTRFVEQDGEVRQYADSGLSIAFAHRQMSVAEADRYEQTLPRPMDLFAAPLVRFEMIETPEGSRMVVECSHLLLDGTAIQTIVADVSSLYAGGTPTPEALSFLDYAEKEADSFESDDYREAAAEAKARFSGRSMTVPDAPRAPKPGEGLADFIESACEIDRAGIDAFCRANGVHPNLFFLGVFARALSLFSNERDVIFHTVNHGRREPSVRSVVGLLVKTVPVCCELKGDRPLVDWLKGLRLHRAGVYPFTHFCRDLGMTGGWGFVYQEGTILDALTLDGVVVPSRWQMSGGSDEMPTLQVFGGTQTYLLKATAKPVRYDTAFLRDFVARCAVIAANFAAADPSTKLGEIPTLVADERRRVLELAKGEDLDYDASKTFVGLFSERVAAAPEATAVVDAEETLSYGELAARANALAAQLAESGVKLGGFVGLMLPRTAAFPTAMIAVQMCGAGYVPMDAEYPADRLAYMLENSEAPVLVTTRALFEGKDLDFKGKVVFLEGGGEGVGGGGQRLNNSTPDTPAYMIYTSGSTGKPKGVVIPNRALTAMIAWMTRDFGLGPGKRNLSITSFSFDASVPDLFPPLAAGGELHILGEERRKDLEGVRDYAAKVGATGLTTSTQLGLALVNTYPELPLEYMLLGGEKMVPFAKTSVRVVNGYGPTEFAVCSSYHEVDQTKTYDIPIGRAVANTWSFVVDRLGQPVPPGMRGEIALAGAQIADGYWRLPEKTAQAFVDCPWREGKMYLTGDYARYDADGELTYEGRIDFQVKLRGFRIEIGEIEQAAATFAGIGPVAAEVREVAGAKHLVLYYSAAKPLDEAALKAHLEKTLTGYMVPDFFVAVEPMPLTPNGKIDRRKLPAPQADDEPVVEPANESERAILAVVKDVLHADGFGVTHDFNRLGLTSLGAMSLLAKLKKGLGFAISMRTLTERPTVRRLAELLGEEERTARWAERSRARPRRQWYPMSENQRGIYADWLRNPETTQYNVPAAFRFEGVAPAELAAAAEQVLSAHPALKARFVEKDGEIVQQRRDDIALAVPVETLDFEPDAAFFSARMKPFAPDAEALCRATVFASPTSACLFLDIHHTVFDGFSVGILLGELVKALGGEAPAGEAYTAFDAALAERDYLESETVDEDEKWFARYLEGAESTALETSSDGADGKPGEAGRVRTRVKAAAITTRAKEVGVTASDWFLTAFTELLRRVGRADDVCINFVTAGRTDPDVQETVGMFVKTLPVRGVRGAATFAETARRMRASVTDLLDRERSSYVRLSEKLGVRPEILFAFEGGIFDLPAGCSLVSPETDTVKAPLTAMVTPGLDDFELVFEYDRSKYAAREMEMLVGMLARLAENAATAGVDAPLASIALLSPEDSAAVLAVSRGDEIAYDAAKTFVNLFNANVIARPFATAVVGSDGSVTYGELGSRSDALAAKLIEFGVKPGGFVGLMLPRRTGFAVSFVAVQKCGAGYVPMDADYPADRLAYMLENSESPVLVTTRALFAGKNLDFKGKVVFYEDVGGGVGGDVGVGVNLATPDTPAYMIYTSGSTGKPKGVVIPQRALRHFCAWVIERRGLRPGKKVMEHASFSFDASVMDLLPTLAAGGELHILPEELRKDLAGMRDYVLKNGIEGGTMSTQIGMAFLGTFPDLPLEYLSVGGEKLMPISKTKVKIVNVYGPTEFTVGSSEQVVDQDREGDIPIGRAMPGTWSLVVDRYGQLLPRGYPGEIALVGPQIADGYWRLPEKTAQVFVGCQAVERFAKMYRTGDLGRYGEDGLLYYMGRLDFQVKLRGFRIEIGEIEHRAATFAGVKGVAAEVRDVAGAKHLVLYYGSSEPLDETAFRAHLAASLTDYMVPDYFVRMDPLPMTPNGKINRKLLPTPAGEACATEYVEPVTDAERAIAETYGEILKVPKFGATTDFFAAGGTSLVGIKAVVALQKKGLDVAYGDLFKYKTPRTLAAFLTGASVPSAGAAAETPSAGAFDYGACDYTAIDQLLMATPTELFDGFRRHSLGDVLLCGATGYLGIHVLRHLLETTDATVYALVRPKKGVGPEKRVDSLYVYYFGQRVPKCFRDRLAFVEGDITDSNLSARLSALDSRPSTVFNCAALVKHYVSDDLMDRINVGGVENLVAWCAQSGARLVHASTYSVGGTIRADSAATLDERHLYIGQESDNDYVRTKFLAERAVLEATAAGRIRGKIMRLGNLMGRESDGEFQMNVRANAFVNSLKSYRAIGSYPLEELANRIEMSPIDRVAEAVCLLATTPDGMVVFHPYNAYPLDMGAVIGAMNRRGFDVDCVSRQEFAARVEALRNDPSRAADLQGVLHYAGHLLKDRRMAPAPNAWTTTVLYRLGFRWKPAEDGYLANFLDVLDGLAVFG